MRHAARAACLVLAVSVTASAPQGQANQPVDPFRIAGNLYYVGDADLGSYLITTADGHILIDAGYPSTVPIIEANVAKLGFKITDVKILLNTQGHGDHAGGFAAMKQRTGATLLVSHADADLIERGGARDFSLGDSLTFPPAKVDRRLKDGATVTLGAMTLTAHLTPGHTQGCTTWTFDVREGGRTLHVVDVCGLSILEKTRVSGMPAYPNITQDYVRTFAALKNLPVDIFIGAHAGYYDGMAKAAARKANPNGPNPFIDPDGYRRYIDEVEKKFNDQLQREKK